MLAALSIDSGFNTASNWSAQAAHPAEIAYRTATRCITNRLARQKHFSNPDIFGEPGWDILLYLYVHDFKHQNVSIKSATFGSGVPPTTALRWLSVLEGKGLISSKLDASDQRRRFVSLTPRASEIMTRYLLEIAFGNG